MKSARLGKRTSAVEVSNVSKHGFWLLIGDTERVPFEDFPWFKNAPIGQLLNVELSRPRHLQLRNRGIYCEGEFDVEVEDLRRLAACYWYPGSAYRARLTHREGIENCDIAGCEREAHGARLFFVSHK